MSRLGAIAFALLLLPLVATAGRTAPSVPTKQVGHSTVFWKRGKTYLFTPADMPGGPQATEHAARDALLDQLNLFREKAVPGQLPRSSANERGTIRRLRKVRRMVTQAELTTFIDEWMGIWNNPKAERPSILPPALWQPMHVLMAKSRGDLPALALKPDTLGKTLKETKAYRRQAALDAASSTEPFQLAPLLTGAQRSELQRRIEAALYERTTSGARLHRLTPELAERLPDGVRTVISGVAKLEGGATGILVWRKPGSRRALVLTNEHVGGTKDITGRRMHFFDGSAATVTRVAAANIAQDYKLLEVDMPLKSPAVPVEIDARGPNTASARGLRESTEVYSIGGGTGLRPAANPVDAVAGPRATQDAIAAAVLGLHRRLDEKPDPNKPQPLLKMPDANFTISMGHTVNNGATQKMKVHDTEVEVVRTDLPNMPGMSGAGLFERGTNLLVGLHTMGNASPEPDDAGKKPNERPHVGWIESAVPIDLVIRNLWLAKRANQLPTASLDLVYDMMVKIDRDDIARGPRPVLAAPVAAATP